MLVPGNSTVLSVRLFVKIKFLAGKKLITTGLQDSPMDGPPEAEPPEPSKVFDAFVDVVKILIGFSLPLVVFGLLVHAHSINSAYASENYRSEEQIAVMSNDNTTFELKLNPSDDYPTITEIYVGSSYNNGFLPGGDHSVYVGKSWGWKDWSSKLTIFQVEHDSTGSSAEPVEIGYYEPRNQTVFFQLDNASHQELTFWMYYSSDGSSGSIISGWVSTLIPTVAGLFGLGIVIFLAKNGNSPYGRGLIAAMVVSGIVLLALMAIGSFFESLFGM